MTDAYYIRSQLTINQTAEKEILFTINGMMDGKIMDEGTVYRSEKRYYLQWVGLGVTRRISKKLVDELAVSDGGDDD